MAVDFLQNESSQLHLLEANTATWMALTSLILKAAQQAGYNSDQFVLANLQQII